MKRSYTEAIALVAFFYASGLYGQDLPRMTITVNRPEVNPNSQIIVRNWIDDSDDLLLSTYIREYTIQRVGFFHRGKQRMMIIPESMSKTFRDEEEFKGLEGGLGHGRYTYSKGTLIGYEDESEPLRLGMYLIEVRWHSELKQADGKKKEVWLESGPVLLSVTPYDEKGKLLDKFIKSEKYRSFADLKEQEYWEKEVLKKSE